MIQCRRCGLRKVAGTCPRCGSLERFGPRGDLSPQRSEANDAVVAERERVLAVFEEGLRQWKTGEAHSLPIIVADCIRRIREGA